tara:strand:- start:498 stop:644 length:147 start_codon:yes stop_codon:yes gene_type:complete
MRDSLMMVDALKTGGVEFVAIAVTSNEQRKVLHKMCAEALNDLEGRAV